MLSCLFSLEAQHIKQIRSSQLNIIGQNLYNYNRGRN